MGIRERDISSLFEGGETEGGWSLYFLEAAGVPLQQVRDIHVIFVPPGGVRGNHIHRGAAEWLLIWGGHARLLWMEGGVIKETLIDGPRPRLFCVQPGVPHALENISRGPVFVLAFADGKRETLPHRLVPPSR